jgi:hypothetical protein
MALDIEALIGAKNALWGDAMVMLVEVEYTAGEFIRYARINALTDSPVTFEGKSFTPWIIGIPKRNQNGQGQIPMFDLIFANPERVLQSTLQYNVVEGRPGRIIAVHRDHLADPNAKVEEKFTVKSAGAHESVATLTCSGIRLNRGTSRIPSRTTSRSRYRGLLGANRGRFLRG